MWGISRSRVPLLDDMRGKMEAAQDFRGILEKARNGDQAAWDALLDAFTPQIKRHIELRLGGYLRRVVDTEDVYQETVAEALISIPRCRATDKPSVQRWLKSIAEHVILNLARRRRIDRVLYVDHESPSATPTPSKSLRRESRRNRLQDALDTLPADYRKAVFLVRIEGLTIKEAARRMGRTPKAVMHLLGRALKRLKEDLGDTESLSLPPDAILREGADNDS